MKISESEEQAHLMLLETMYKIDTVDNARLSELLEVLRLAHKYNVKFVLKKCKYRLQSVMLSPEICEKILCFIKVNDTITDVEDLEKMLQSFLAKEFSPLDKTWQTKRFEQLSEATLKCLLSSDELVAASENTVFHALMHWIKQRGIDKVLESTELPSLLSVVRFELIPIDYLYNMVQHNALAKKFPDFNKHYLRGITYHALSNLSKPRSCQPVNRKASTKSFIPYTWVIATDELDKHAQSGKLLKSDHFWYCGYRMVLVINRIVKILNLGESKAMYDATLSLAVTNLTEQSEVMIRWKAASQSFTSTPVEKPSTFNKKAHVSSVKITYSARTAPTPVVTPLTPPSKPSSSGPPQSTVGTSTGTATTSGLFSFPQSTVGTSTGTATTSGLFGSPQSTVSTSTGTTTTSGLFSFPQSTVSTSTGKTTTSGLFSIPKSHLTPSTGTASTSGLMSSTPPSKPSSGFLFGSPKSTVSTSTGTATTSGLFSFPQSTVSTSTGTATSGFTFSTSPSKPSGAGGFTLGSPQSTVSTSTGTATSGFTFSTSPSKPSGAGGFTLGSPQSTVSTSTGTATSGFTFSTSPSKPSGAGGFTLGSPQSTVSTSIGTATSGFTFSTSPSKPSGAGGFTFGSPQSTVSTSTGTATSGLMFSTSPSKPSSAGGFTFGSPQSTVSTSTGTATTGFTFSTSPSKPSGVGGFTFGSPQSTVSTSTGTATTGFTFSTSPSKPSGAGVSSRYRFPVQKSPNSTCLSIDVSMSLVQSARYGMR